MLKFINLQNLTAKTLIGILMIGGLVTPAGTKQAAASDGVQGLELRYLDSAFQCGPNGTQGDIRVKVYDEDDKLLTNMSKGDTFTTTDIDSASDLRFKYKIKNTCFSQKWRDSLGSQLLGSNDPVPNVGGYAGQASILEMLNGLDSYEELYLAELGTSDTSSASYDLQDVVLIVDNNPESLIDNQEPDIDDDDSSNSITLTGTVRDFQASHPDFERSPGERSSDGSKFKFGLDKNITTDSVSSDRKPIYKGGSFSTTTQSNFDQWYRDVDGVNQREDFNITLTDADNDGIYRYENTDFFPINDKLFGNYANGKNFHFTYELHTNFTYQGGEVFNFRGDDDVWVYINGQKVIDIGGVHSAVSANVNLDDVANQIGITKGETYSLDFFFAERHTTKSNLIIETTIELEQENKDSDFNGIPDVNETLGTSKGAVGSTNPEDYDLDDDGTPDYLDRDDDGDGIADVYELYSTGLQANTVAGENADLPYPPNYPEIDLSFFGSQALDSESDLIPNYHDLDSDNDGIYDKFEYRRGSNSATGGAISSGYLPPVNTDQENNSQNSDSTPDYLDLDSDGDGISDELEGRSSNGSAPLNSDQHSSRGSSLGTNYPVYNDYIPDFQDTDSDDNGILDRDEVKFVGNDVELTTFKDGNKPNFQNLDDDGDGIADIIEIGAGAQPINSDNANDGADYQDEDSDNDGMSDAKEGTTSGSGAKTKQVTIKYTQANGAPGSKLVTLQDNNEDAAAVPGISSNVGGLSVEVEGVTGSVDKFDYQTPTFAD